MNERPSSRRRWSLIASAGLALLAVMLAGNMPPAGAHSAEGIIAVEASESEDSTVVTATVKYLGDGDIANGASVSATASGGLGEGVGPVVLEPRGSGVYRGTMPLGRPGEWTITVVSESPSATASTKLSLAQRADPTTVPAPRADEVAEDASARRASGGSDDSTARAIAIAVIVAALVAGATVFVVRTSRSAP